MTEPRRPPWWLLPAFVGLLMLPPRWAVALSLGVAAIRTAMSAGRWARRRRTRAARVHASHGVALGVGRDGRTVEIGDDQLAAHGLILGASGSGKSTTLLRILTEHVRSGTPVVAIDLKGSPAFARVLAEAASAAGRPFVHWTPDGPAHWNPLGHGNATELKDKLIGTERFTEPHYQRAAERYLQTVLQVLERAGSDRPATLEEVVRLMDPGRLAARLRTVPRPLAERVLDYLTDLTPDQLSAIRGLGTRLAILTESHTGQYLAPSGASADIDLRSALEGPEVVLFSLNSSSYGKLSAQIGTLVIQDLVAAAGTRLSGSHGQAVVAIDEFSALGADHLGGLVARAREAGLAVLLVTQEFADLNRAAPGLRDQVVGNTTLKIIHRQDVPDSAFLVARMAGTERVPETSYEVERGWFGGVTATGRGTRREVERFVVDPNRIATLRPGEAVVITKAPESQVRTAWVIPSRTYADPEAPKAAGPEAPKAANPAARKAADPVAPTMADPRRARAVRQGRSRSRGKAQTHAQSSSRADGGRELG